ncbi:hypothetical protein SD77_0058 [Bacillus badius]|uniref:Ribose 5-phosphate isomerase B n=1 Tax=Bacillus badius TaxID=1455 RepID=A0ABR5AZR5_BACBA|nr:hypothetical protein SD78_3384 [Bacillus badius]KIL80210.1 hypothetical protein SD77_0058 [Bacillus badius]
MQIPCHFFTKKTQFYYYFLTFLIFQLILNARKDKISGSEKKQSYFFMKKCIFYSFFHIFWKE